MDTFLVLISKASPQPESERDPPFVAADKSHETQLIEISQLWNVPPPPLVDHYRSRSRPFR